MKRIGWIGYSDNKPLIEDTADDYVGLDEDPIPTMIIFKTKREALKRFEDVRPVFSK